MERKDSHKHGSRHHKHHIRMMRRMAKRRGRGFGPPPGGPGAGRGRMIRGFFAENPDCAEKMARYGVAKMKEEGVPADEIRDHLDHMQERGLLADLDIEAILEA